MEHLCAHICNMQQATVYSMSLSCPIASWKYRYSELCLYVNDNEMFVVRLFAEYIL